MKNVLFVCVGNAGRSQMAEAFFNHLAGEKAKASSAGTDPANIIDPTVVQVMKEVTIDISSNRPKKLTAEMLSQADKVITMGCGTENICPASFVETEDWELEDPKSQNIEKIRKIRDQIKTRVEKLIKEMQI
ncbi:MAG: arsenate reductase ArsC [Chloroflexi bacterium]|nr:arsenate reductase ArsC [Chloroflexota bacterium]MBM4450251.1 arsenate reductase ArsC [Chloroflexota bacterium]